MSTVQEIERAVRSLPAEDLAQFRSWFADFDAIVWDQQLDEDIKLDKRRNHSIEVVVDRLLIKQGVQKRLDDSVHLAAKLTDGLVLVSIIGLSFRQARNQIQRAQ